MTHFVEVVAQIKIVAVEVTGLVGFLCVLGFVLFIEADNFLVWVRSRSRRTK